jgi:sortase (surface protein transpeptidase)
MSVAGPAARTPVRAARRRLTVLVAFAALVLAPACGGGHAHDPVARTISAAPAAAPAPGPTPVSTAAPDRLLLPSIGVSAHIESVGTTPQGAMDVPALVSDVAWYAPGVRPGQAGDAVIDGHLDWYTGPAVFLNLSHLAVGDRIVVVSTDGTTATFGVTSSTDYPASQAPADLFSRQGPPRLSLITCSGSWDGTQYQRRLVVDADLLPSAGS